MNKQFASLGLIVLVSLPTAAQAGPHRWDSASSVARDALVVAALGVPLFHGDWKGDKQAALGIGAALALTEGLKYAIPELRPDGSNRRSFPSGHTSSSFAAAATLEKRYGWRYGLPAHVVAAFVGVARVKADKHFVRDVLAGAAIGEASGWLATSKRDARVRWMPWGDAHGGGAEVAVRF